MLGSQAFHEVRHSYNALLLRWGLTHESWRIWRETIHIHLGEVNRCVLAGAGEYDGGQKVVQLGAAREGGRGTVVCMACRIGIAIVM